MQQSKAELVQRELLKWFGTNRRSFPWRQTTDPYRIVIAEIMLQRTKAPQVEGCYLQFLQRFPSVQDLSAVSVEDISQAIASLGLAWRAEKIKALATDIVDRFSSTIPSTREELLNLPGIGDYIADAVLCFAFEQPVVVVDWNVARFICRFFGIKAKGEARRDKKVLEYARRMIPQSHIREFNWALLDLTALVCKPRKPSSSGCPLRAWCAHASSMAEFDTVSSAGVRKGSTSGSEAHK